MAQATYNGAQIAQSEDVALVEFAVYFPLDSVAPGALRDSAVPPSYCHWKGLATYFDVVVGDTVNEGAAWTYAKPYDEAKAVAGKVAFWKGVEITGKPEGEPATDPGGPLGDRTGYQALTWLLVRTKENTLSAAQIEDLVGLGGEALTQAFHHEYATLIVHRYKWNLQDGTLRRS